MTRRHRQRKPAIVRIPLLVAALFLLLAGYIAAMRWSLDVSRLEPGDLGNHRDRVYLGIHLAVIGAAAIVGFALGRWLSGLGVAMMTLFVIVVAVGMLGAMLGSHALACSGHNDIIRHWSC